MLYFENSSTDPFFNQAFEDFIFNTYPDDDIFLLWRNRPAVVCGCYQNLFAEVDVPEAQARGVALVRRISGGGTVYHDLGNINYSFIRDNDDLALRYDVFLTPVVEALNRIGAPVSINRKSDIAIDGLKVSGSAQKATSRRVLHHGTLLYDCDLEALSALSNGQRAYFETKGTASVPWPVTNIRAHMADPGRSTEEFAEALLASLGQTFELTRRSLSEAETEEVKTLAETKYKSWEWNFGRTPAFTYRRSFTRDGVETTVEYTAKKGIIQEAAFTPRLPGLEEALKGRRLHAEELQQLFAQMPAYRSIFPYIL